MQATATGTPIRKSFSIAIGIAGLAIALSACGGAQSGAGDAADDQESAAAEADPDAGGEGASATEPDLSDIPDVVAEVNGEPITKDDFTGPYTSQYQQSAMQAQQTGQAPDEEALKSQLIESLVSVEVLEQEAASLDIAADDARIDEALAGAAESNQLSTDEFLQAMEQQGMDEEEVRKQVGSQETIALLVEEESGPFEATDDAVQEAYDQAVTQQDQMAQQTGQQQEMPPLEDVRPQLEQQVVAQQEAEATDALAAELREAADVTIHL